MEPATYEDLRKRMYSDHKQLHDAIKNYLRFDIFPLKADFLMGNLTASVIFCRLKYYLDPDPLPAADDAPNFAAYYKRVYNTSKGKADFYDCTNIFKSVIRGYPYLG